MLHRSKVMAIQKNMYIFICLCCVLQVRAGGRYNSSALSLDHKSVSKVPGVQTVLKVVPLTSNRVALLQIKNLGHTVQ